MERDRGQSVKRGVSIEQERRKELEAKLNEIIRAKQHTNINGIAIAKKDDVIEHIKKNVPKSEQADLFKVIDERVQKMQKGQEQYKKLQQKHTQNGKINMKGIESDINKMSGEGQRHVKIAHVLHQHKAQQIRENKVNRYVEKCGGDMFLAKHMISQNATCQRDHQQMLMALKRLKHLQEQERTGVKPKPGGGPEYEPGPDIYADNKNNPQNQEKTFEQARPANFQTPDSNNSNNQPDFSQNQNKNMAFAREQDRLDYNLQQIFLKEFHRTGGKFKDGQIQGGKAEYVKLDTAIQGLNESEQAKDYMWNRLNEIFREDLGKQYGPGMSFGPGMASYRPDSMFELVGRSELRQSPVYKHVMQVQGIDNKEFESE
ncbi:MAG: hypothetical protein ACOCQ4_01505 [bacterium]